MYFCMGCTLHGFTQWSQPQSSSTKFMVYTGFSPHQSHTRVQQGTRLVYDTMLGKPHRSKHKLTSRPHYTPQPAPTALLYVSKKLRTVHNLCGHFCFLDVVNYIPRFYYHNCMLWLGYNSIV